MKITDMRTGLILGMVLFFAGCSKDDNNGSGGPDAPAVITITTPGNNAVYINGTTLRVLGNMTDTDVLATARVEVRHKTNNTLYYQQSVSTGNVTFYGFTWDWVVTGISASVPATVKVTAVDRKGNEVSQTIDITLDN